MDVEQYTRHVSFYTEDVPEMLLKYMRLGNWQTYLDLGCGDGALLNALNRKGCFVGKQVYAVDLSEKRIDLARKVNREFECYVSCASEMINIKDNSIDFLVSTQVLEHVPNDENMVREISRVLRRDGIVYLSTIFKKWYGWYFYKCNGKWTIDPTHIREYTEDNQLVDILIEHNFMIVESNKRLVTYPLIELVARIAGFRRDIFMNKCLNMLRRIRIPIVGYYDWTLVLKKKEASVYLADGVQKVFQEG